MAEDEKRIAVVVGDDLREVTVRPGTTCADVLAELGVGGDYWLARRDGQPLGADENVWACADGEKLVATLPVDVSVTLRRVRPHRGDWAGACATCANVVGARLRACGRVILERGIRRWLRASHETVANVLPMRRSKVGERSPCPFKKRFSAGLRRWMRTARETRTRAVATRRNKERRSGAVRRNTRPFELERNWTPGKDGVLSGYYKTRGKRPFQGAIDTAHGTPEFYICDRAGHIKQGDHGACLRQCNRGKGWYHIHYAPAPTTIASGIIAVEQVIRETTI